MVNARSRLNGWIGKLSMPLLALIVIVCTPVSATVAQAPLPCEGTGDPAEPMCEDAVLTAFLEDLWDTHFDSTWDLGAADSALMLVPIEPPSGGAEFSWEVYLGSANGSKSLVGHFYEDYEHVHSEQLIDEQGRRTFHDIGASSGYLDGMHDSSYVAGLRSLVTFPAEDYDEFDSDVIIIVFSPSSDHADAEQAAERRFVIRDYLAVGFGLEPPFIPGVNTSSHCMTQYNICLLAAGHRLEACQSNCGAATIGLAAAGCLASLMCAPIAVVCCIMAGGVSITAHHFCMSSCQSTYEANQLDCLNDLIQCDPSIVIP